MRRWLSFGIVTSLVVACGAGSSASNGTGGTSARTNADAGAVASLSDAGSSGDDDDDDASLGGSGTNAGDASSTSQPIATLDAGDAGDDGGASLASDAGVFGRYGVDGPSTFTDFDETVTHASSSYTVHVYMPSSKGVHPVVLISAGLEQPGDAYAPYAKRLASWGIVAITRDDPGLTDDAASVATDLEYVVTTWLAAETAKSTSKLYNTLDTTKIALAGHSKGGQAVLLAAEGTAKGHIRAVFGIDPVDSSSLARTSLASIAVPLALLGETTDNASSGCAPAADDFLVLYADAASPAVAITATNADHTMFEDPNECSFCSLCTAGTADAATVLAYSVRYLTAFFARELLGDATVGAAFAGAGAAADIAAGNVTIAAK